MSNTGVIYPITKEGIDLYLQPLEGGTKDVRQLFIPHKEI